MDDRAWMRLALEEAKAAAALGEVPVGALVVRSGELIAKAHNRRETGKSALAHAECLAIDEACKTLGGWRLHECELYVTLEPCPMCAGAISQSRLRRLIFGAFDKERGCAGSVYRICEDPAFPWFTPADGGVLEEECTALLEKFFQRARR